MRMLLAGMGLLVLASTALAAERTADREVRIERRPDGKLIYVTPSLVIIGKVQRPQALFVLPRPQVSYDWPELKRAPSSTETAPGPARP
jgi:hypothetical protein